MRENATGVQLNTLSFNSPITSQLLVHHYTKIHTHEIIWASMKPAQMIYQRTILD